LRKPFSGPNATGTVLGTEYAPACTVANRPNSFFGIKSNGLPIESISLDCQATGTISNVEVGVANLQFVPATVPEPGTITLLASAGIAGGVIFFRRRRRFLLLRKG